MVYWRDTTVTEPPLLSNWTTDKLLQSVNMKEKGFQKNSPTCMSYAGCAAVERCVKLVTEASESVVGESARYGFIRSRIISRQKMSSFQTKKEYSV